MAAHRPARVMPRLVLSASIQSPVDRLEHRVLFAGGDAVAKVNFQPAAAPAVSGYLVDAGSTYAARNGLSYGWTVNHTGSVYDRNINANQLLDTGVSVQQGAKWELAVPSGDYTVKVSVGDAATATTDNIWVEGVSLFSFTKQAANTFANKSLTVKVTDGRLTVGIGSAATGQTHVNYIEVTRAAVSPPPVSPPPVPPPPVSPPPASLPWGVDVKLNFQPDGSPLVAGYIPDLGRLYKPRNGQTYGWSVSHIDRVFDRNLNTDQKLDTSLVMRADAKWELAVPAGQYSVTVGVGDAAASSDNTVLLEGTSLFSNVQLAANSFASQTSVLNVTDGWLTLTNGLAADQSTHLTFLTVKQVFDAATIPAAPTNLSATAVGTRVQLNWDAVPGATRYDVYRVSESGALLGQPFERVSQGVAVSAADPALAATTYADFPSGQSTAYRYQVVAINAAGSSQPSEAAAVTTGTVAGGAAQVLPADPARQAVVITPGTVAMPGGGTRTVKGQTVVLADPDLRSYTWTGKAPPNYTGQSPLWRWPDESANLVPAVDTLSLGGPYHAVLPGSVVVSNATTGHVYVEGVDYRLNGEWGQVLNLNGRLGAPGTGSIRIAYRTSLQRLDLLQVLPDGSVTVKKGVASPVAPKLPSPDAGAVALAGIHINTLDGAVSSGFRVLERDIYPIHDVPPVAPINADAIPNTRAKLAAGKSVNIAYFGDSITFGAESKDWVGNSVTKYTARVTTGLRSRYPSATITQTDASQGGVSVLGSEDIFQTAVLNPHNAGKRVDLLVIALGMNDLGIPNLDAFKAKLNDYISRAQAVGMEVLLVTPMQSNPYYDAVYNDWVPRAQIAEAIRQVGLADHVSTADVYTAWMDQAARGIAPVSQLHNWFNHPGDAGHQIYADTILRFF